MTIQEFIKRHPLSQEKLLPKEFNTHQSILKRCRNKSQHNYHRYGGRGITVCDRWQGTGGFANFFADMGFRPEGHTIDRIDNDGDYYPENCQWATPTQQARNSAPNRYLTYKGETRLVIDWAETMNLNYHTLYGRLFRGWSAEKALETPVF